MENEYIIDCELNTEKVEAGASRIKSALTKSVSVCSRVIKMLGSVVAGLAMIVSGVAVGALKKLGSVIAGLGMVTAGVAVNGFKKLTSVLKTLVVGSFKLAKKAITGFKQRMTELHTKMSGGTKNLLKYALGIGSLVVAFRKMRQWIGDGIKNLAQFNNGMNPTNKSISALLSSFEQMKNTFGTAFAPILTVVQPILTSLIDKISDVVNAFGMLIAKLTGASTFTKAIKYQKDFAKSLSGTAKTAKGALASFDELQTLQKESGGGGAILPSQMFEEVSLDDISWLDDMAEKINTVFNSDIVSNLKNMADIVKTTVGSMFTSIAEWGANLNFQPLITSFNKLLVAVTPLVDMFMGGLKWCLDNVLLPFGSFVIQDALPKFFEALSSGANLLTTALQTLQPTFDYIWQNILQPIGSFAGEVFLQFMDIAKTTFESLATTIQEKGDKINYILTSVGKMIELVFKILLVPIIQFAMGLFKKFSTYIGSIFGDVIDILASLIDFLKGVFTGNLDLALTGIKDVFKGLFNFIVDIFEGIVNGIIHGINSLSFDVPDWVPAIGGTHVGFNLAELNLPRLANGNVIPRQAKEQAYILGDNNRETEIVSPLSTMEQAMRNVLSEMGGLGSGDVYVSAEGDLNALVRLLNFKIKKENNRVGGSYVKAGVVQ